MDNCEKNIDNQENEVPESVSSLQNDTDASKEETPEKFNRKFLSKRLLLGGAMIVGIIVAVALYFNSNSYKYGCAKDLLAEGKYEEASTAFTDLGDYKDSKDKISECNRRILYNYLLEKDSYTLSSTEYTYELKPDGDKISIAVTFPTKNVEFSILIDMTSDKGQFICKCAPFPHLASTSDGDCKISSLRKTDNDLETDNVSGYYDKEQMKSLSDIACNVLCMNLGTVLESTDTGLTADDIGFNGLK